MSSEMSQKEITAAVCLIGTELVRGIIQDTHTKVICSELTKLGFLVQKVVVIPDSEEIYSVLDMLSGNVDLIITTGGLGPTSDDITREAIAAVAEVPLVLDQAARKTLKHRIQREPDSANLRQVMIPQGFRVLENPIGTAPGMIGSLAVLSGRNLASVIIAMPGPPVEMQKMFYEQVVPYVCHAFPVLPSTERDEYSVFLIPESKLEEACSRLRVGDVTWGTRFQTYKISLYIIGGTKSDRAAMIEALRSYFGADLICDGEVDSVKRLTSYCVERGITISCAESCTGGLVSQLLTQEPGSSQWFWGSCITYDNKAKVSLLNVPETVIESKGAVSEETAGAMADGMLEIAGTDAAFSITGIAGPGGGSVERPVGLVWFGFTSPDKPLQCVKMQFPAYTRDSVRRKAAITAMILCYRYLRGEQLLDIVSKWQYS